MWLPTYSLTTRNYAMIVRAFREVFPNTTIWYEPSALNAFTIVTGKPDAGPWNPATLSQALVDPQLPLSLADLGIQGPADLLACYLAGGEELATWLERIPPHTDDIPAVEYESGALLERNWTWLSTFSTLLALRPASPPAAFWEGLSESERSRAKTLWESRGRLLADQRRFLAEKLTNHSLTVPD